MRHTQGIVVTTETVNHPELKFFMEIGARVYVKTSHSIYEPKTAIKFFPRHWGEDLQDRPDWSKRNYQRIELSMVKAKEFQQGFLTPHPPALQPATNPLAHPSIPVPPYWKSVAADSGWRATLTDKTPAAPPA